MQEKIHIQFSPTRLKQIKKIALSGSRAKLQILNGKLEEGFHLLKSTAKKLQSFATDLADRIPQALAARISLDLFSHFERKSSKRLGIPKGIALGGVLALMCVLPAAGQDIFVTNTTDENDNAPPKSLRDAIVEANNSGMDNIIYLPNGSSHLLTLGNLPTIVDKATNGTLQIICTGTTNAMISGGNSFRPLTMAAGSDLRISKITITSGTALKGGGIYNNRGDLTISSCLITKNAATGVNPNGRGAGIYSTGQGGSASVLIQNSTISLNTASHGGGISNRDNSLLTISSSSISGNTVTFAGGGISNFFSPNLSIFSSTISGNTSGVGGGIYNRNSANLSISNSSISGNTVGNGSGGGIYNGNSANLSISSSSISGNTANFEGGGISNSSSTNLSISNSSISGNMSNFNRGGGISNFFSNDMSISSSSISDNTSSWQGGGISNRFSDMTIQASSITTNQSTTNKGGGIYIDSNGADVISIINSTISSNEASVAAGGGIYARGTGGGNTLTLQHVTISNNSGTVTGGFANAAGGTSIGITMQNSIIANSIGADFTLGTATLTLVTSSIVEDGTMAGATSVDPLLGALTLNSGFLVHPLLAGSPAIDAAANIGITTDQVGNNRGILPDIGALDLTGVSVCMVVAAPTDVTNTWIGCTNSDWSTATNWSAGTVPTASDVVYVPSVAANQLVIDEVATCRKMIVQIGAKCLINYDAGGKLLIKF